MLKRSSRIAAVFLAMALILPMTAITTFAAASVPIVSNGVNSTYNDGGISYIDADTEVFITPVAGSTYYYSFNASDYVDVFYNGTANNPKGSYFDGALEQGALVTKISVGLNKYNALPVAEDLKITIKKPASVTNIELFVIAYNGDEVSEIYSHLFYFIDPVETLTVTNGADYIYSPGGVTGTDIATDVYITDIPDNKQYYYSFATENNVDVFYDGINGFPKGSYFEGPLFNGAFVTSINGASDWTLINEDGKITIPAPAIYDTTRYNLIIKDSLHNVVFTHTFKWFYSFSANYKDSVTAELKNDSNSNFNGRAILAVYNNNNVLVYNEQISIKAEAFSLVDIEFNLDISRYPLDNYRYATYCWIEGNIPVSLGIGN